MITQELVIYDTNALEGIRVVLSMALLFGAGFALANVKMGLLVIPKAVRSRIGFRRGILMSGFLIIAVVLGAQSMYVSQIPNPEVPSLSAITANFSVIITLFILCVLAGSHTFGWWREGNVVKVPLSPEAEERAAEAVERAREIAHTSKTALAVVVMTLENIMHEDTVSKAIKAEARLAFDNVYAVSNHISDLHEEIKLLKPLVVGELDDSED